jgi:hypothetical protein
LGIHSRGWRGARDVSREIKSRAESRGDSGRVAGMIGNLLTNEKRAICPLVSDNLLSLNVYNYYIL